VPGAGELGFMPSAVSSGMMTAAIIVTYEARSAFWPGVQTRTMTKRKLILLLYVGYGVLLQITGGMLAGMGDGPAVEGAIFGSPFTLVPVLLIIFPTWIVVGYLLENGRVKAAERWLQCHYVLAPFAVYAQLASQGFSTSWASIHRNDDG